MLESKDELKLRAEKDTLHMLTAYLLYERREETELRLAFAALVGERHHTFHDKDEEDTAFTECPNLVCINALKMLQAARKPRIEINQLSIDLVKQYNLTIARDIKNKTCIGYLEEETENIIKQPDSNMLRVD